MLDEVGVFRGVSDGRLPRFARNDGFGIASNMEDDMASYLVANYKVTAPEAYQAYTAAGTRSVKFFNRAAGTLRDGNYVRNLYTAGGIDETASGDWWPNAALRDSI